MGARRTRADRVGIYMITNNRAGIIILGILVGVVLNIGRIGSEAFLLSTLKPIHAVYIMTIASALFALVLPRIRTDHIKFSKFGAIVTGAFMVAVGLLLVLPLPAYVSASGWFFLVMMSTAFHRWMVSELAIKHLNPAIVSSYFSYIAMAYEVGTLLGLGTLKLANFILSPKQTMGVMILVYLAVCGFLAVQFFAERNLEIRFEPGAGDDDAALPDPKPFKTFLVFFVVISLAVGAFQVAELYLITLVLKDELQSYNAIRDAMLNYYLIGSVAIIFISAVTGNLVQRRRISPIWILVIYSVIMLVFAGGVLGSGVLQAFIAFEVARRVGEVCFFNPANQMIVSSFVGRTKRKLGSQQVMYYSAAVGLPLAGFFSYTNRYWVEQERSIALGIILGCLALAWFVCLLSDSKLVKALYAFVESGGRAAAIVAVQSLSFLRPRDYHARMSDLLLTKPKKVLRKTIIIGLGHFRRGGDDAVVTILNEFKSDKEEIQIAVLDALKTSNQYKAIQFLANIMMAREESHSLKVRMNASAIIAGLYGNMAIPFLLNGLEDEDERIVANTLEVLSVFRDRTLIPYFLRNVDSVNPRVRANALMGLANFRSGRAIFEEMTNEILEGSDTRMLVSILYVVGKLRDSRFMEQLGKLLESPLAEDPMVRRGLAWALTRLDDTRGFDLFAELFGTPFEKGKQEPYIHFFSQLSRDFRLDLIKYFAMRRYEDSQFIESLDLKLRNSHFDFHEEIEYLRILMEAITESYGTRKKAASPSAGAGV